MLQARAITIWDPGSPERFLARYRAHYSRSNLYELRVPARGLSCRQEEKVKELDGYYGNSRASGDVWKISKRIIYVNLQFASTLCVESKDLEEFVHRSKSKIDKNYDAYI